MCFSIFLFAFLLDKQAYEIIKLINRKIKGNNMRIEIFSDAYLPGVGGSEIAVSNLARALNSEHEVAVACPRYKEEPEDLGFPVFTCKSVFVKKPSNYCAFSVLDKDSRRIAKWTESEENGGMPCCPSLRSLS